MAVEWSHPHGQPPVGLALLSPGPPLPLGSGDATNAVSCSTPDSAVLDGSANADAEGAVGGLVSTTDAWVADAAALAATFDGLAEVSPVIPGADVPQPITDRHDVAIKRGARALVSKL